MKNYMFTVLLTLFITVSFGLQEEIVPLNSNAVNVRIETDMFSLRDSGIDQSKLISHTFALSARDVEIVINQIKIGQYDHNDQRIGEIVYDHEIGHRKETSDLILQDSKHLERVYLAERFTFREMTGFTVNIELASEEEGFISIIEELDYDILGAGSLPLPESISRAFYHSYQALADNFDSSYLVNLPFKQPAMLIISDTRFTDAISPFIDWKRQKGFEVTTVNKSDIGVDATNIQIKEYIRGYYNQAENKPDYLLLTGDVNLLPTFYYSPQNIATDLPYTLIEGDDYFPEMLVGRISVTSAYQLATVVNKSIANEKEPFTLDTDWMKRALVVSGTSATQIPYPSEPNRTSERIARLLEESGYEVINISWNPGDGAAGTQEIIASLNEGVQIVTALSWGDANGWHYPQFHISHLSTILNLSKMPYVTSFVSNTADFANTIITPCFAEYWMRMGTPNYPNGAVSFIGATDIYTSNQYTNVLALSYHVGVQKEGIRISGSALLRAKMELYRNFPSEQQQGQWVKHYFHAYNPLADPSLNMWVLVPDEIDADIPESISAAAAHIELDLPEITGGYVTISRDNENYEAFKVVDGKVFIPLSPNDERDIKMTISAENYLPLQQIIEVTPSQGVALHRYDFDGSKILPGNVITMNVTVKNNSNEEINDVTGQLRAYLPEYVNIVDDQYGFGDIEANGTGEGVFRFEIEPNTPRHTPIQFGLSLSPSENTAKIQTIVGGILLSIDALDVISANGVLDPGETTDIRVTVSNNGEVDAVNLIGHIIAGSNAVIVQQEPVEFGNVPVGEERESLFSITALADAFVGRQVSLQIDFQDENGLSATGFSGITIGEVTNTSPTGPCSYGYFAYDSYDTGFELTPVFDWRDIDPQSGGQGEEIRLGDDETIILDLPFSFFYYGKEYDTVSICSNGWVSFQPTSLISFINYSIPSYINPPGVIAPFWDDLLGLEESDNHLRIVTYHDEAENIFIISWLDAYNWANLSPSGEEKFQLILKPQTDRDGDILFQYDKVWNQSNLRNYSSTGIQSPCNTMGLQYAFSNSYPASATAIKQGLAILFTTEPPDNYTYVEKDITPVIKTNLHQNYPNPFNPDTTIEFSLKENGWTELSIYNILGQKIRTLSRQELTAGKHSFFFDGKDDKNRELSSGVYFYKLITPAETKTRRMILMK